MRRLRDFFVLPRDVSAFEDGYLRRTNAIALPFLFAHVPALALLAWVNGTSVLAAFALAAFVLVAPVIANHTLRNARHVAVVYGVTATLLGALLLHVARGPLQSEMRFYFFALVAMLAIYGSPLVILAAASVALVDQVVVWCVLPPQGAPLWIVGVHAAFVVLESAAACFVARAFHDSVVGLERIVDDRTRALDLRNRDMRLVLDSVRDGFLTIDRAARPSTERSAAFDRWFAPGAAGETLFDRFERASGAFGRASRACWDQVVDGVLPVDVAIDQMPRDLDAGGARYRVTYTPIGDAESAERFLVVVADVTDEIERARIEEEQRETLAVFERILVDRAAFEEFFEDATALVRAITTRAIDDLAAARRQVHTLKGNAALYGLPSVVAIAHRLESHLDDERSHPPYGELALLAERWTRLASDVRRLLGERPRAIEIDEAEHGAIEHAIRARAPYEAVLAMVHALKLEPTKRRLEGFAEQARAIAGRMNKGPIDVVVEDNGLRVDGRRWAPLWSALIHAVRNAVDHGLEPTDERAARGKARGRVALRTYVAERRFFVEVADDGRGVDWTEVARKALDLHLAAWGHQDLVRALFFDGMSTARALSDVSGRGVGMGALRAATEALGGSVDVLSGEGIGTTIRLAFPVEAMTGRRVHVEPRAA